MSKRKGLSVDEKRKRMLEIFDSFEFYTLKELEKLGSQKGTIDSLGVVSNTIKEIIECLQADGLVQSEKVGTSNYFFRFPKIEDLPTKKKELDQELRLLSKKNQELDELINVELTSRPETEDRTKKLEYLAQLQTSNEELQKRLESVSETVQAMKRQKGVAICKQAANRWTENIFSLESFIRNEYHMDMGPMKKECGIPADLDTF
jgi:DNA-binding transcriptional MocR family regulator